MSRPSQTFTSSSTICMHFRTHVRNIVKFDDPSNRHRSLVAPLPLTRSPAPALWPSLRSRARTAEELSIELNRLFPDGDDDKNVASAAGEVDPLFNANIMVHVSGCRSVVFVLPVWMLPHCNSFLFHALFALGSLCHTNHTAPSQYMTRPHSHICLCVLLDVAAAGSV